MTRQLILTTMLVISLSDSLRAQTLSDAWSGGASFRSLGTVSATVGGDFSVIQNGSELWAYYGAQESNERFGVALATSADGGKTFVDKGFVLRSGSYSWCKARASFPGVARDGKGFVMAFEAAETNGGGGVGLATSSDGKTWTINSTPILQHNSSGWESGNIGTPSLYRDSSGIWHLFYHAYGRRSGSRNRDVQLGVATGRSLTSLQKFPGNPIVATSALGFDEGTQGDRSSIIKEGEYYYMAVEASTDADNDRGDFTRANWTSTLVRAKSLTGPWDKLGRPILPTTTARFGNDVPELVRGTDGRIYLFSRSVNGPTERYVLENRPVFTRKFQEGELKHLTGKATGNAWFANTIVDPANFLSYGPYRSLPVGKRVARFKLAANSNNGTDTVVSLDVYNATAKKIVTTRNINRNQFVLPGGYDDFELPFSVSNPNDLYEFRVYWHKKVSVYEDYISVR